jgi:2-oxoglutarate dehydrogenase E2 component (dihydrolipoamide succinyltransferase)
VGSIDEKAAAPVAVVAAAVPAGTASAPKPAAPVAQAAPATAGATNGSHADDVRITPSARKLADEYGVNVSSLHGTGPGHRIREQDVLAAIQVKSAPVGSSPAQASTTRSVMRERMTPMRQRIASRLVEAQHTAAMLTTFNEVDMTAVMDLRKAYKEEFEKKHGIGLGFMGFFVKAAASALKAFPMVNAFIVSEGGQPMVEKHDYCDIAVAVSTPKGLVVPVLRSCEKLSLAGIENGIKDLAIRAKDGKLALEDMQGGTFTITNGGIFGSLMSTPIINPPQSAILGMHAIKNRAVEHPANSGHVAIRPMMYLALSYDHRIIDGADAVQFLVHIKKCLEDPQRLILEI